MGEFTIWVLIGLLFTIPSLVGKKSKGKGAPPRRSFPGTQTPSAKPLSRPMTVQEILDNISREMEQKSKVGNPSPASASATEVDPSSLDFPCEDEHAPRGHLGYKGAFQNGEYYRIAAEGSIPGGAAAMEKVSRQVVPHEASSKSTTRSPHKTVSSPRDLIVYSAIMEPKFKDFEA